MATTTTSHTSPSPHNNGSISSPNESVRSSSVTNSHRSLKRTPSTLQRNNLARSGLDSDVKLTDDEIELVLADLAQTETNIIDQTWSRYFVEKYFSHYKWYNPNRDVEGAPSIRKGWAYFEHFTLPRRYKEKVGGHRTRSPPGEGDENTTKLYSYFGTGEQSLSDWGIGMSMYFASLRSTAFILIFVGALNVVNIFYYSSDDYDQGPGLLKFDINLSAMLQYSAVCTDREWVVCANPDGAKACGDSGEWDTIFTEKYYGTAIDDANDGKEVTLIHRTTCDMAELLPGMINYTTLMILILLLTLYMWYLGKRELRFDEDNTTPSDYTLVVRNPPKDAVDPDEWRDFFSTFSDKSVTLCTVALNNGPLVAKLVTRRKLLKTLKQRLLGGAEIGVDFDERDVDTAVENARRYREGEEAKRNCLIKLPSCIFTTLQQRCLGKGLTESMLWERIKNTTKEIEELQKAEYKAAAVFVTFETELGQRTALEALNASELEILTNVATNLDATALFRGEVVLRVEEASEPNSVRWKDLHTNTISRYLSQIITMAITTGLVSLSGYVLYLTRLTVDTFAFAIILSALNSIIPIVLRSLVSFEKHYDEGAVQRSFYINITFFRWVNTAIITRIVTPTLATIGAEKIDLINTVNSMMISEMVVSPMLRYLDFSTILKMHYFAPRAKTEEEMLSYFTGGWYNLGERFTDFTKVLLLCTFFGTFYPLMYFLGAGILFFQYWMDKFLLLRSWQRAPYFGARTPRFSRTYFNSLALMLGVSSSAYAYFKSSFTMLCSCDANNKECILPDTQAFTNVELNDGTIIGTTTPIVPSREGFYFCNQDIDEFPPLPNVQGPDKWMTDSQEMLSNIYGMTCLVMLIIYCVLIFGKQTVKAVVSLMKGVYKPSGCNQNKDFSCGIGVESFGYVPQLMKVPASSSLKSTSTTTTTTTTYAFDALSLSNTNNNSNNDPPPSSLSSSSSSPSSSSSHPSDIIIAIRSARVDPVELIKSLTSRGSNIARRTANFIARTPEGNNVDNKINNNNNNSGSTASEGMPSNNANAKGEDSNSNTENKIEEVSTNIFSSPGLCYEDTDSDDEYSMYDYSDDFSTPNDDGDDYHDDLRCDDNDPSSSDNGEDPSAIEFELSITFQGRKYNATRAFPTFVKLRNDLVRELNHLNEGDCRRHKRHSVGGGTKNNLVHVDLKDNGTSTAPIQNNNGKAMKEGVSVPELPRVSPESLGHGGYALSGVARSGFALLQATAQHYCPEMEHWMRQVIVAFPCSQSLSSFLWEPLSSSNADWETIGEGDECCSSQNENSNGPTTLDLSALKKQPPKARSKSRGSSNSKKFSKNRLTSRGSSSTLSSIEEREGDDWDDDHST